MAEDIKAFDGLITIPRGFGVSAQQAIKSEEAAGRGGLLELFPGMANRQTDMTQEELVAEMDKVLWATEYPLLTFERSLDDVAQLPLRDHVRPKYLRDNALRLFNIE